MMQMRLLVCALCSMASGSIAASCRGQEGLLPNPSDPSQRGPYQVGRVLGYIDVADGWFKHTRNLTVEVWYPAMPGSEKGRPTFGYDIREHLPLRQRTKLHDAADITYQTCDCFNDLPIANGTFPVLAYIHGTAAFRTESLQQQTHWASRGFVVVAADHPGIQLFDLLGIVDGRLPPRTNQQSDVRGILNALQTNIPKELAILSGHLDWQRVAVVGHSAGGFAANDLGDVADVLIPMAGFAPKSGKRVKSVLVLAARNDTIVPYPKEIQAYAQVSLVPRRFASVDALGHLFCSDLCWIGASAGGIVQIALDHGISAAKLFSSLGANGCAYLNKKSGTQYLEPQCGWAFVNYASSGVLEETLRCDSGMAAKLSAMKNELQPPQGCPKGIVFDYREHIGETLFV
mmetsp:Transcript_126706/g.253230  ORF Transcript_126706/g.253230 Transcript_126706/m.253230 type:complete len:402 (+) Transcript_126706:54-1259(+)